MKHTEPTWKRRAVTVLLCLSLLTLTACGQKADDPAASTDAASTNTVSTDTVSAETTTAEAKETETTMTETETSVLGYPAEAGELSPEMRPLFEGNTVQNETLFFIDKGTTKKLLYPATAVESVTSYDGSVVYEAGRDYELRDGGIYLPETSTIPVITEEVYYGAGSDSLLQTEHNGKPTYTYWGESQSMTRWQIAVTYTHEAAWAGFVAESHPERYGALLSKLAKGEDVTVLFYGDSITYGSNSSFVCNHEPFRYSYPMMFTCALADLYGYTVEFTDVSHLQGTAHVPAKPYKAGERGVIRYINVSVGGWNSPTGVSQFNAYVKPMAETYGCDLFVVAYGMNDGGAAPKATARNIRLILEKMEAVQADASSLIVSTMVPNPQAVNGWYAGQPAQEPALMDLADGRYEKNPAVGCAVAPMTSVSLSVLEHKEFVDYTGNNINHPNDFFTRVYAQTLFQTLIGYEHLK